MHTHNPTWDDCQQLLKTLFTTEERERILTKARKNVPSVKGRPTTLPNLIKRFPLNRPDWDFGNAEVAAGWPPCLRIIAAVALMVKDADKLTFGQHLKVVTPHAIEGVLKHPPDLEVPLHECQEILAELTQVHPDLQDVALPNSELVWYTGGSSFIMDGMRRAGMAVVDQDGNVIWSASLPLGTSAQKAELIALAEALE
ncbi:uncharacterized protein LOC130684087 isoform X2 [Manis pentadactyla]|uniref:uncharacterized protein LOC130684087 isoform X2 n=1 Tax=Manis pentadactyla TaxID=143292 RepID=UPI00255C6F34|nr:uncharacterized protein LOC130684087 isoform X2 [Manis pentadactyla]